MEHSLICLQFPGNHVHESVDHVYYQIPHDCSSKPEADLSVNRQQTNKRQKKIKANRYLVVFVDTNVKQPIHYNNLYPS